MLCLSNSRIAFLQPSTPFTFSNYPSHSAFTPRFTKCIQPIIQPKTFLPRMTLPQDPLELRVRQELAADGINLNDLLNPTKVLSLTRNLDKLTETCSSIPSNSPEYQQAQQKIAHIHANLIREKRQVMQRWLKRLFLIQALLFVAIGGALANNTVPYYSVPLVGQALGFWMTWLFSIPALRARKGTDKWEKSALNLAFLATPILNLTLPLLTKNCATIWAADVALLVASYLFYAASAYQSERGDDKSDKEIARIKGIFKYLDWGSWR